MSRSRRRSPVRGITTSDTEKQDKRGANRKLRRKVRAKLRAELPTEADGVLPALREVSSAWAFAKDGKARFDPRERPAWMRK